jgi:hypothetical protein
MKKPRVSYKVMCRKLSRQEVRLTHVGRISLLFNRALSQYILMLIAVYIELAIGHDPQQLVPFVILHSISPCNLILVTQLRTRIRSDLFLGCFLVNVL